MTTHLSLFQFAKYMIESKYVRTDRIADISHMTTDHGRTIPTKCNLIIIFAHSHANWLNLPAREYHAGVRFEWLLLAAFNKATKFIFGSIIWFDVLFVRDQLKLPNHAACITRYLGIHRTIACDWLKNSILDLIFFATNSMTRMHWIDNVFWRLRAYTMAAVKLYQLRWIDEPEAGRGTEREIVVFTENKNRCVSFRRS